MANYIRRDDPNEVVKINSQERCPNGVITFEFIKPEHHKGRTATLSSGTFNASYKPEHEPPPAAPTKPLSTDTKDEWRAWALHMEKKYKEAQASYERVCRQDTTGNTW